MLAFFFFWVGLAIGYWFRGTAAGQWVKKAFSKTTVV